MGGYLSFELTAFDFITMLIYATGMLAAFLIGIIRVYSGHAPMYFKLIIYSIGCRALEGLGAFVSCVCTGNFDYLRVSNLSYLAAFAFIAAANIGAFDKTIDEGTSGSRKAKLLALLTSAVFTAAIAVFFVIGFSNGETFNPLSVLVVAEFFPIPFCAYFSMKQLLLPLDALGFLKATRPVNLFIVIELVLEIMSVYSSLISTVAENIMTFAIVASLFAIVFSALKGAKIWKTLV